MKTKSLKIQLVTLFILAFINVLYFSFPEFFGDSALRISDLDLESGKISYFLSSLLSYVSYFSGVWTAFCFVLVSLFYSFILSRRDDSRDIFVPFTLFLLSASLSYIFFPKYMGKGILYLGNSYLSIYTVILTTFISMGLTAYLLFKGSFFKKIIYLLNYLSHLGQIFIKFIHYKINLYQERKKNKVKLKITDTTKEAPLVIKSEPTSKSVEVKNEPEKESEKKIIKEEKKEVVEAPVRNILTSEDLQYETTNLISTITDKIDRIQVEGPDREYYEEISRAIVTKLSEFNIATSIAHIRKGPVVDTFELELGEGVKVAKVIGLSDDISMALRGTPIRLVYPLKGKTTVGIEVPRSKREFIYLDEILNTEVFNSSKMRLPIAMGRDVFGEVSVVDLAAMPHMLVAGATGAGKSVFVNSLLVSLLVRKSPREMKLLLIDPKQLELALYANLPHLCLPVITEAKNATVALLWAVEEMDRRYSILKNMGVRNIEDFNKKIKTCDLTLLSKITEYYSDEDSEGYELPYIVIVIDEFADLILTKYGKDIENSVNRLAAKARAAGIHLVLATQRPSTDIITGVIKANFPTRVAFRVTTATDSRVVLDQNGAEKLLGKGDMLYKFGVNLDRLHSSYIDEDDITGLVSALEKMPGSYSGRAMDYLENGGNIDDDMGFSDGPQRSASASGSQDELFDEAVRIVIEQGGASASMLQRRLRVGYNRAANLVEEMERRGIVGPQEGSKQRKVLASSGE